MSTKFNKQSKKQTKQVKAPATKQPSKPPSQSGKAPVKAPVKVVVKSEGLQQYVKKGMPIQDIKKLKQCFDIFDYDGSGQISPKQIQDTIVGLGLMNQAGKILGLIKASNKDNQGGNIDFEGFMKMFGLSDKGGQDQIKSVFDMYDVDGKGYIQLQDFKRVCQQLGEHYTPVQIQLMMMHADNDKDGKITLQQFSVIASRSFR